MKRLAIHVCFLAGISLALFALHSCTDDNPVKPPPATADTTSHSFVWHTDTLGDWLSYVNDVFCLSETDAWAVGWFYKRDDAGKVIDSLSTNAAHWDGEKWTLMRTKVQFRDYPVLWEPRSVFAFSNEDLWFDQAHWNGHEWKGYDLNPIARGAANKIWGKAPNDMYFVGLNGSLLRWDGIRFYEIGYNTTAANWDVWGWEDTVYVAVTDYDYESGAPGYMIKIVNGRVQDREYIFGGNTITVWGMHGVWYGGGCSSLHMKTGNEWRTIRSETRCIKGIRGTALNNVFVVLQRGSVLHLNGKSWKEVRNEDQAGIFFPNGISATGKAVFIAGDINYRSVIHRGYRQPTTK